MKKSFQFEFNGSISGYGYVDAEDKEEAIELINNQKYDDIMDTYDLKVEDITSIKEYE